MRKPVAWNVTQSSDLDFSMFYLVEPSFGYGMSAIRTNLSFAVFPSTTAP